MEGLTLLLELDPKHQAFLEGKVEQLRRASSLDPEVAELLQPEHLVVTLVELWMKVEEQAHERPPQEDP